MKKMGYILFISLIAGTISVLISFLFEKFIGETDFPIGAAVGGAIAGLSVLRKTKK
jgi:hypothetical protein